MDRIRKYSALPPAERGLIRQSLVLLPVVSAGLRFFGFERSRRWLAWRSAIAVLMPPERDHELTARRIGRLVSAASQHGLLKFNCLPRSLVIWFLLRRHGLDAELRIGVQKQDEVQAHAWVEFAGQPLAEPEDPRREYAAFPVF